MITINRCRQNPLLVPADVKPSRADFKVDGIFNCGVTEYQGEIILLCRVAESVVQASADEIGIPIVRNDNGTDQIDVVTIVKKEHPEYDFSDSRKVGILVNGQPKTKYLTSLSHIRIARSTNGVDFTIDDQPFLYPTAKEESWGMEDPRITCIDGCYYINYTSVTPNGAATSLITTSDFKHYQREGVIFAPENKDVTIFPEKINGNYVCFNRPVPLSIGSPDMWIAQSPDLIHWGHQQHFCGISSEKSWDNGRIGGGAVPIKTDRGWIKIYHAADDHHRYCLGAFLLDLKDPSIVLKKTKEPILEPATDYEKNGFFGDVVFTCGCLVKNDTIMIYYGAADDKICRADITLEEIFRAFDAE